MSGLRTLIRVGDLVQIHHFLRTNSFGECWKSLRAALGSHRKTECARTEGVASCYNAKPTTIHLKAQSGVTMPSEPPQWPVQKLDLSPPSLDDVAAAVVAGLTSNFEHSSAVVEHCPDLRLPPFHLAGAGLSGHRRIADVGGQSNLAPVPDLSRKYDILSISKLMEMSSEGGSLIGAGAGPFHVLGVNSELMPNVAYDASTDQASSTVHNLTHYAKVTDNGTVLCERIGQAVTGFGLMANLYGSDGLPGPALHIKASARKGKLNFTETIQQSLKAAYGDRLISIGGVFVIRRGKSNLHVMPGFPSEPFRDRKHVEEWLKYFDTDAPMVCLGVFHSGDDQGLGLRMEHTHCFSVDGGNRGGHYHNDLDETMGEVEYEGWFNTAETLYRIDPPAKKVPQRL
jgi:Domain of Unknown Function (DUF1907)